MKRASVSSSGKSSAVSSGRNKYLSTERLTRIYSLLLEEYGFQKCFLEHETPFQLLVATILSAQCTDRTVNIVTKELFKEFSTPQDFAEAELSTLETLVHKCGYYRAKARHIKEASVMLCERFGGILPSTMEELITLPGVGRKTANVILSVVWDRSAMAVDTHVFRVSHRIGLVPKRCTTPYSVEMELMKHLPADIIPKAHHWLILHGRYMCTARAPKCDKCGLTDVCKEYNKIKKQ